MQAVLFSLLVANNAASASQFGITSFNQHRVPVLCKTPPCSSTDSISPSLSLANASLEVTGGGAGGACVAEKDEDELSSPSSPQVEEDAEEEEEKEAEETLAEVRGGGGGSTSVMVPQRPCQPLRISTTRKGTRKIRNSLSSGALRRRNRRERSSARRKLRQEKKCLRQEQKSHKVYAKKLKNRNNLNIKRKVLHAGFGLFFATLNQLVPREIFVPGMTVLTSATLVMELLRYRKGFGWMNDALHFVLGGALRKSEMEGGKFTGSFYYFLGVTVTSSLFPTSCATLGICQLALADPSASFFGRQTKHVYWSRIENGLFGIGRNKGFLGFLGGAATCFPFNYHVLSIAKYGSSAVIPGGQLNVALASIALGLAGAFADLCVPTPALTMPKKIMGIPMPRFHVDDNVVVPIVSGYACTKIFECLGWTSGVEVAKFILF